MRIFLFVLVQSILFVAQASSQHCNVDWKFSTLSLNQQYLLDQNVLHRSFHNGNEYQIYLPKGVKGIRSNSRNSNLNCLLAPGDTLQIDVSELPYSWMAFEILDPVVFGRSTDSVTLDSMDQALSSFLQIANLSDGVRTLLTGYNDLGRVDSTFSASTFGSDSSFTGMGDSTQVSSKEKNFLVLDSNLQIIEIVNQSEVYGFGFKVSPLLNLNGDFPQNQVIQNLHCGKGFSILLDISASVDSAELDELLFQIQQLFQSLSGTGLEFEIITFGGNYSAIQAMQDVDSLLNDWNEIDSTVTTANESEVNGSFTDWPLSYIRNTERAMFFVLSDGFHPGDESRPQRLLDLSVKSNTPEFQSKNVAFYAFHELSDFPDNFFRTALQSNLVSHVDTLYRKSLHRINDLANHALSVSGNIIDQLSPCTILALEGVAVEEENGGSVSLYTPLDPRLFEGKEFSRITKVIQSELDPDKFPELIRTDTLLDVREGTRKVGALDIYKWKRPEGSSGQVALFPNPGTDRFQLNAVGDVKFYELEIINTDGRVIRKVSVDPTSTYELLLVGEPPGKYTATISYGPPGKGHQISIPFIKL